MSNKSSYIYVVTKILNVLNTFSGDMASTIYFSYSSLIMQSVRGLMKYEMKGNHHELLLIYACPKAVMKSLSVLFFVSVKKYR